MGPQNALKDFAIAGAAETPAKSTGVYMAQASRSTVALIATTILAMLFLIRGTTHPGLNYDVIPYVALAKEMRSAGGKVEAYRELARRSETADFNYMCRALIGSGCIETISFFRLINLSTRSVPSTSSCVQ